MKPLPQTVECQEPWTEIADASSSAAEAGFLRSPLEHLLVSGGDSRLDIDPGTMLNIYGCRPRPRPEACNFSSSTASSISERGFAAADAARSQLIESVHLSGGVEACDHRAEAIRERLRALFGIDDLGAEIALSSSGTDSQIHALFVTQSLSDRPLVSIVAASDETGSGTRYTASGRHFSTVTASAAVVDKGGVIPGMKVPADVLSIDLWDDVGRPRTPAELDDSVRAAVADAVAGGYRVVLQAMDSSKLGRRCPSLACLEEIALRWGDAVQVVVDACQARLSRARLRSYLERRFMVLMTGSKFFGGPPFSGALIVPAALSAAMAGRATVPDGLSLYSTAADWPLAWRAIRAALPARPNFGQLLRWEAAIEEMRAYAAIPESFRAAAISRFATALPRLVAAYPCIEPLALPVEGCDPALDAEFSVQTIFPFFVRRNRDRLSMADCAKLYRALNRDMSALFGGAGPNAGIAAGLYHIGQPVAIARPGSDPAGALRISAGARFVSDTWSGTEADSMRRLDEQVSGIGGILDKIELLVETFEALDDCPSPVDPLPAVASLQTVSTGAAARRSGTRR